MAVYFLLGEGGSGKSHELREEVIRKSREDPRSHHIVFVPEQSTFMTQQAFIKQHPRRAMLNIEVISFGHLARRVFREFSADKATVLGENGKRLLLALASEEVKKDLTVYGGQVSRPGFLTKLGSLFAEWDMNDISPERLLEIAEGEGITPLLSAKLKDLAAIYRAFKRRLGEGRVTAEEMLPRLLRLLPYSDAARGACLYFDGFTGFTSVQYRLITELIRRSRESLFVFTLPKKEAAAKEEPGKADLFGMSIAAMKRITRCAADAGTALGGSFFAGTHRPALVKHDDFKFLEENLMRFSKENFPEKPQHIHVMACRNVRTECRAALLEIMRLAREEGFAWRDIAVTLGDKERYLPALEEQLREAGIPYFTDRREPLSRHPLIRMLEAALDAVTGNFDRDSVLRYLKNECGPLSRDESDRFENYLLSAGIRGGRSGRKSMTEEYSYLARLHGESDDDYTSRREQTLEEMNALRERIFVPLLTLKETVRRRGKAEEMAAAVLHFLEETGAREKLLQRAEAYEAAGRLREADEWKGVFDSVSSFLQEMQELLADMPVSAADFCLLVKTGLEGLKLGLLPAEPDQLLIGDMERSRMGDIKALLVLGFNEGVIPGVHRSGGIITDRERILLERFEPDLGYTDEKALLEERFYIYRLLTRPVEQLYLSFSQLGPDGKAIAKSPVLTEIEGLFPALKLQDFAELCRDDPFTAVANKETAARVLAEQIRRKQGGYEALYALLLNSPDFSARLMRLEEGALLHYRPVSLSSEQAEALYGKVLKGSVTRLERFAACAYRHFLQYGLGLEERDEHTWQASDHGSFFHKVMEVILRSAYENGGNLKDLDDEARSALIRKGIREAAEAGADTELQDKANSSYLLDRWENLFTQQIRAMSELETEDGFRPERFELRFGGSREALELDLGGGARMSLSGQIDRLDVRRDNGTDWIRVVDYKTSDHQLDLTLLSEGLQLQLFTYLDVALERARRAGRAAMPGGLYYAGLTEKWLKDDGEDAALLQEKLLKDYRLSGMTAAEVAGISTDVDLSQRGTAKVFPAEALGSICRYIREKEIGLGREILDGRIDADPVGDSYSPCTYCEFRSICRFDRRISGMKPRTIRKVKRDEFAEIIGLAEEKEVES